MKIINKVLSEISIPTRFRKRVNVWIKKDDLIIVGKKYDKELKKFRLEEAGGGVELNKSIENTAIIECLEELGIKIVNLKIISKNFFKTDWYKLQASGEKMDEFQKERMKKYRGSITIPIVADFEKYDNKIYGRDLDAMKPIHVSKQQLINYYKNDIKNLEFLKWKLKMLTKV